MVKKVKTGGRVKGSVNKRTRTIEEIAAKFSIDPFEVLMMVATNDWKGLGYENANKVIVGEKAGIEFSLEEPNVKLSDRVQAAKEASRYLYAQKQAIALSGGQEPIKLIIEDYRAKVDK